MPLKSILVHVADDEHHIARLNLGVKLALEHGAHLRALFLTRPAHMPAGVVGRGASRSYLEDATARANAKAAELQAWFRERCDAETLTHDWLVEDGEHLERLARHAHVADLVIVSQSAPRAFEDRISLSLGESIALAAGCPTICLPEGWDGETQSLGRRVMVAWREDREAVRAVRGAIPLLQRADAVSVVSIDDGRDCDLHPDEVSAYLGRHGVKADATLADRAGRSVSDALVEEAAARNCDLVVMGAYSRSSVREILLGGVSRTMFTQDDLPILASH